MIGRTYSDQWDLVFVGNLRRVCPAPTKDKADADRVVAAVLEFIGQERLIAAHPPYRQGDWFAKVFESTALHLQASGQGMPDWASTLDLYEGVEAIPLMTIHKSKGLEYHTVIFIGLDDGAWWSFNSDQIEGTAGFFVAFTRAKQRVVFTYCARRGQRNRITSLYRLLHTAGVQIAAIR